jgi:hypothetical protein
MDWANVLAEETGFSPDIFHDILYIMDGKIIHVLLNVIDRPSALRSMPKQDMTNWPRGQATHRIKCMCGRLIPVEKGILKVDGLDHTGGGLCRYCVYKLPAFMCDKAILELVGLDENGWIHADTLRIGRIRWRA